MSRLEALLSSVYIAEKRGKTIEAMADLKSAIQKDEGLKTTAETRKKELDALVEARGEKACAFSTKYRTYLAGALS